MLLVAALVSAFVVADVGVADAKKIPETLADQRPAQVGVIEVDFPIDYLAVTWNAPDDVIAEHHHDVGNAESHGAARFRYDGRWGQWTPFSEEGAQAPGQWSSGLIAAGDAEAYQVRGIPAWAASPSVIAINTTDGPLVTVDSRAGGGADALSNCLSRAEWGADESYRFVGGVESWPPTFYPVQTIVVHHTVTANDDPDPAATVRAIYYHHAVGNDWGDIAYHYLVDEAGVVYEGRWSGSESAKCATGGDGSDFAHNSADEIVTAGHTAYHNQGNVGIALLGNFASPAEYPEVPGWVQVDPKPAAVTALTEALAELVTRHDLNPTGTVDYYNPVWETENLGVDTISGHRDWRATACPGASLYALLGDIRLDVKAIVGERAPVVVVSEDPLVVEGDTEGGYAGSLSGVSASDPDGDEVTLTNDAPVLLPVGDTVVTWTATDPGGLFDTATQTVSVADTQPPELAVPADVVVDAETDEGASVSFVVSASDVVDPSPLVVCDPVSGSVFPHGETAVTCAATDATGNEATDTFNITVVGERAPVVVVSEDPLVVEGDTEGGYAGSLSGVSASDPDGDEVTLTNDAPVLLPVGDTVVTWTATDPGGLFDTAPQTVSVADTQPPELAVPADVVVDAETDEGASVSFVVSASDVVDPSPLVVCDPVSGSVFPHGETAVTCAATDATGNEATDTFNITVLSGSHTVGLVDPARGRWHLFDDTGIELTAFYYGNPGDYPMMGDWDGDGIETPGLYRRADGYVYLRNENTQGNADIKFFFGNPGDVPIAGDFDNDGFDTVSIYRPSNQTFYIINELGSNNGGLGAADFSYIFGNPGDKPFVGDFDGDGIETVGLHRESTGLVYFRNTHTQGNADAQFIYGNPGDRFVAGDWNGDGMFSPALFRPSNTTTYFRYTNTQGNADAQFVIGQPGWIPVAGATG